MEDEDEDNGGEAGGFVLYRTDTPVTEPSPEEKTGGLILCEDLYAVNFLYYDENGEEHKEWDPSDSTYTNKLPLRVTIQLAFIDPSDPEEPLKFETAIALPVARVEYEE